MRRQIERVVVAPTLDPESFKNMMAQVAASVTVVTTSGADGPVGLTVSAFQSVSAEPPIVLVCLGKQAGSLDVFLTSGGFTVNFLPEGTGDMAMLFATKDADRFGSAEWSMPDAEEAGPVLAASFGHFACRTVEKIEMGDHWVFFGEVAEGGVTTEGVDPLIWHGRGFVTLGHPG